jgi:Cof subfamily protein (haloacid dehalogenase superfamily)
MIRLAAFDLDQTLIGDDLVVSESTRHAINAAQQSGVIVALVTGRGPEVSAHFARLLGLTAPVVCYQGGMVYDFIEDKIVNELRLPVDLLPAIVREAKNNDWNLHFEVSGHIYLPPISNHPPIFYELIRVTKWSRLDDLLNDLPSVPHKFIVTLNHPLERAKIVAELSAVFAEQINIIPSHPYLVEGLPAGVDKGCGLAWLADYYHIPADQVLAVGDNDNDVPMLKWAGLGVAVGNASPMARAAADWIAPPVSQDGAAATIEKYILGNS